MNPLSCSSETLQPNLLELGKQGCNIVQEHGRADLLNSKLLNGDQFIFELRGLVFKLLDT